MLWHWLRTLLNVGHKSVAVPTSGFPFHLLPVQTGHSLDKPFEVGVLTIYTTD